jgi:hypothetical protein
MAFKRDNHTFAMIYFGIKDFKGKKVLSKNLAKFSFKTCHKRPLFTGINSGG